VTNEGVQLDVTITELMPTARDSTHAHASAAGHHEYAVSFVPVIEGSLEIGTRLLFGNAFFFFFLVFSFFVEMFVCLHILCFVSASVVSNQCRLFCIRSVLFFYFFFF
jgi:hypothetical protein